MATPHRLPSFSALHVATITYLLLTSLLPATNAENSTLGPLGVRRLWCNSLPPWLTPRFNIDDCREANTRFILTDYDRYKRRRYEFLDQDSPSTSRLPRMRTPRRYTIGSCTIVIAMLWSFPDQPPLPPLPGGAEGTAKSEVSTYEEIYEIVQQIYVGCCETNTPVGWLAGGKQRSLGVFYMATGSELERNIPTGTGGLAMEQYLRNVTGGISRVEVDVA